MLLSHSTTIRPTNYNLSYNKIKSAFVLSFEEKDFLSKVMDVPAETSHIGSMIQHVMANYNIDLFRQLVTTLLSQRDDNPEMMQRVLGVDCYNSLLKLKP